MRLGSSCLHRGDWRAIERSADHLGLEMAGTFHSHVASEPIPGGGDIRGAHEGDLMLILDPASSCPKVALWRIGRGKAYPVACELLSAKAEIVNNVRVKRRTQRE